MDTRLAGNLQQRISIVFGKRLRDRRKALGMSQEEMGRMLGISKQAVSCYERGIRRPTLAVAWVFSTKLDVPLDFFCTELKTSATMK